MASATQKIVSSSTNTTTSLPQSPSQVRLVQKIANTNFKSPQNATVNWGPERMFTPRQAVGYRTALGIECVNGTVQLFHANNNNSHGLIIEDNQVVGASVTTEIHTLTNRKKEKKSTFIQYDKTRVNQSNADFKVKAVNRKGKVNYEGGHLIDHKFSTEGSHTTEINYFPQHFKVNSPFKEYLVNRCESFVETPLYTPNPPTIRVRDKNKNHRIPVGEVFIQINKNEIQDVYFFPNNDFDYEGLQERLNPKNGIAAEMTPYFKLKPCFHPLFQAAIVTDFTGSKEKKVEQSETEKIFIDLMDKVSEGMGLAECDDKEEEIVQLAYSVIHKEGVVDPSLILNCNNKQWDLIKDEPLEMPFNTLGKHLVAYVIRNALKSEVLSIHTRLVFLSGIIDFIDAGFQVSDDELEFVDSLAKEFKSAFDELDRIKNSMNQEELFFFANVYQRISHFSNHAFSSAGYAIYFCSTDKFFVKYIALLGFLVSRYKVEELKGDYASNFLDFIKDAHDTLGYLIKTGFPKEEFEVEDMFLKSMCKPCLKLLKKQEITNGILKSHTQTNINRGRDSKTNVSYLEIVFENLGLSDSDSEGE